MLKYSKPATRNSQHWHSRLRFFPTATKNICIPSLGSAGSHAWWAWSASKYSA